MNTEQKPKTSKKTTWFILIGFFMLVAAGIVYYTFQASLYPSTDDSYVQAHITTIAPQVNGFIKTINVSDHQRIKQGDVLFTIDPAPYAYAYARAEAQLKLAQEQANRMLPLVKSGKLALSEGDKIQAQIDEATASFNQAKYDLDHTTITAPSDGIIANFTLRTGDYVTQGVNLFSIVEQDHFWVDANFKETQLKRIHPGQTATVKIDMYPGIEFKGVVDSISSGSGTVFSLLPPENATGNWVKVTQRVTVKINIINSNQRYPFIAGTSAVATVNTVN